ncbi:outer membrane receptor for ferrienterochelin and colicins [Enterobacter sp. BIGb0383]|uniref:TonB-dependent receptor n=1 Tax=unclassified Enterobacter TaxID=2608935 RepID=UPI000F48E222|nr:MULTISPECIES: TonB-dependent receptor [unclassified Enterobacter]ROP62981.1 outer membrane receptor for ferrienterochelin and colicins [Enterobacter sp. BIGb0383]ROS13142.1 outer membrane receptor for ferrienterochelin and colicins [Enterobacter sp. BIGb0359]
MKKNKITAAILLAAAVPAFAQDDTMVITASGYEQKLTNAPASISVIGQDELTQKNYSDLGEALSGVEGVDVRGGTGKTGGLDISIRGMPSSYTLILIDGIRQNASSDTTPNGFDTLNTAMMPPLSAIDHIEVIRGPMSTLYGSDAMGGVINIITKKSPDGWHGGINLSHSFQEHSKWGDSSTVGVYTSGTLIPDTLDMTLRGNFEHRQGSSVTSLSDNGSNTRVPYPTKSDNYTVGGRLNYHTSEKNTLWIDGETSQQEYDNRDGQLGPVGTSGGGYREKLRYQRNKVVVGHDSDLSFGRWSSSLSYAVSENKGRVLTPRTLSADNSGLSGQDRQLKNTNTIFDTSLVSPLGDDHLLTVGGQYWDARLKDGIVLANSGETFNQKTWALFTEDDWQIIDPLSLTWGARYEKHDSFGGHISPRAYLVWNALDNWTVKGGVSTGYKAPSLSQLHNGVSGVAGNGLVSTIGNPDLKPETSVNYETGLYYENADNVKANITGFISNFRNAIDSETLDDSTYSYRNVGKAINQGIEFATSFPVVIPELTMNLNYTYTDSKQRGGENPGAPLTNTARHMANAKMSWQVNDALTSWVAAEYHGKTPRYTSNVENLSDAEKAVYDARGAYLKAWTVVNMGAAYRITPQLTVNGTVNNVLDKDFSKVSLYQVGRSSVYAGDYFQTLASTTGYVTPGRNYWLSLNYTF